MMFVRKEPRVVRVNAAGVGIVSGSDIYAH